MEIDLKKLADQFMQIRRHAATRFAFKTFGYLLIGIGVYAFSPAASLIIAGVYLLQLD